MKPAAPLRLLIRSRDGAWSETACRDLGEVRRVWSARDDAAGDAGILCSGLGGVSPRVFDAVAKRHEGRMLLTAAVRSNLPPLAASAKPVATVEGTPLHLGASGWEDAAEDRAPGGACSGTGDEFTEALKGRQDWLGAFRREHPDEAHHLLEAEIRDDASYLAGESALPPDLRRRLGIFRARCLAGADCADPCGLAGAAPPWLKERKLDSLPLPPPAADVLVREGVGTVGDLADRSREGLLKTRGLGHWRLRQVLHALVAAMDEGPLPGAADDADDAGGFLVQFRRALAALPSRYFDVLTRRLGFERESETLKRIGDDYGLTRERIRQMESIAIRRSRRAADWLGSFAERMAALLEERRSPLAVSDMEREDPWFEGVSSHRAFLENLVAARVGGVHPVDIDGARYFGSISQEEWDRLASSTAGELRSRTECRWSEEVVRNFVGGRLPPEAREFAGPLWRRLSPLCRFATGPDGKRVFVEYGRTADMIVRSILAESEAPLHFRKIAETANRTSRKEIGPPRSVAALHQAAMRVGHRFSPGFYGLRRHLDLSDGQMADILGAAEGIVLSRPERLWHSCEVLAELQGRSSGGLGNLDEYGLDIVLAGTKRLVSPGRMTWTASGAEKGRMNILREAIAIVEDAGVPLREGEIMERLGAGRGLCGSYRIAPHGPLVPLRSGFWGLNDRDVPVKRGRQPELIEILVARLEERRSGIPEGELHEFLTLDGCPPRTFAAIAVQDGRLKIDPGRRLYLAKWGGPRRPAD